MTHPTSPDVLELPGREADRQVQQRATAPFWGAIASCVELMPVQDDQTRAGRKRRAQTRGLIFGTGVLTVLAGYAHWGFLVAGILIICASGLLPLLPGPATKAHRWLLAKRWRTQTRWQDRVVSHDGRRLMVHDAQGTMIARVLTNRSFKRFVQQEDAGHTYVEVRPEGSKKRSEAIGLMVPRPIASLTALWPGGGSQTRTAKLVVWIDADVQDARVNELLARMS